MQTFALWRQLSQDLNHEILEAARLHNKGLYRRTVRDLSAGMRRSVQVMMTLPRDIRHGWFHKQLSRPEFDVLGHNLVINWLQRAEQEPMMVAFMDGLGVAHNGHGCLDNLPDTPSDMELERICQSLYERFPEEQVTLYLSLFEDFTDAGWAVDRFAKNDQRAAT
jgi:hypothetical protein